MKKLFFSLALVALLLAACKGTSKKEAADALEATEIERIDSIKEELNTVKAEIDSSVAAIDDMIKDL
jgi:hypothetical protein